MNKNDLKNKFIKQAINRYYAIGEDGEVVLYRREDLSSFAIDACRKGEKYFYCEPVDKNNPLGELKISEPIYRYSLQNPLTEEEFNLLFDED